MKNKPPTFFTFKFASFILMLIGIILRCKHFLDNRSLWVDEALLAHVIIKKPLSHLALYIGYTEHYSPAPIGFLLIEKMMALLFVPSEFVLRFFPLVFSLCSLVVFYFILRQFASERARLIALGLFVFCEPLVYYSAELRPYSLDVLITLLLYYLAYQVWQSQGSRKETLTFSMFAAVVVWYSFPSIFIVAGLTVCLLLFQVLKKNYQQGKMLLLGSLIWVASYTVFQLIARRLIYSADLKTMVPGAMMPWSKDITLSLAWMLDVFVDMFQYFFSAPYGIVGVILCILGLVKISIDSRERTLLLVMPVIVCYVAAMAHVYPFLERRILFLLPMIIIMVAEGIAYVASQMKKYARPVIVVLTLVILFHPVKLAVHYMVHARQKEEMRPIMQHLKKHYRAGDAIYMNNSAHYPYGYYHGLLNFGTDKHFVAKMVVRRNEKDPFERDIQFFYDYHIYNPDGYLIYHQSNEKTDRIFSNNRNQILRNERTWIIFSHLLPDDQQFVSEHFNRLGQKQEELKTVGSALYLYDLSMKE